MKDILKIYNPANSAALTPEQLNGLRELTSPEIKELAESFPNISMQRAYLLIADGSKPLARQIPTLSSFENLWNLRERNSMRQFIAIGFRGNYQPRPVIKPKGNRQEVLDLSEVELMDLPGFKKTEEPAKVIVRRVRKSKK